VSDPEERAALDAALSGDNVETGFIICDLPPNG
jgi:hypothetical protein